ncbi:CesT family type III secretion system chaperone [Burkholderia metallica]|uniref:CesT family type III secretion system chaperone n=1 Tax=Burkholderia metallica TaxID=488729 RepID=UPI001CF2622F|nr:CesT family type III secretion system chaperone [Burkholderia metallica]MCA8002736.1 CesT family type III secretion system chaperone [Burkholderia metallica]
MNEDFYAELIASLCEAVGLPDVEHVLETHSIEVGGFDVRLDCFDEDPDSIYLGFDFGAVTAGRITEVYRLMLEANLLVYAQDQAQLGLDSDYGNVVLLVRVPFADAPSGDMLADLLAHYAEHGSYWKQSILEASDERFEAIVSGNFSWIRA